MACSYENEGVFNPSKSRIKVFTFHEEGRFAPYTCSQCAEAWCLHACPVDAITINPGTGAKDVSEDVCVGCKVCTIACPFGTVNYNADLERLSNAISVERSRLREAARRSYYLCRCFECGYGPNACACGANHKIVSLG